MGLPEELFSVVLEVGHCACHHKIPGPLAHTMIDIARKSLELWRRDERAAMRFCHNGVGWSDQPPGNNWAAVRAGGFGMLETDRAGGILGI